MTAITTFAALYLAALTGVLSSTFQFIIFRIYILTYTQIPNLIYRWTDRTNHFHGVINEINQHPNSKGQSGWTIPTLHYPKR